MKLRIGRITIVDTEVGSEREEMVQRANELEDRGYYNLSEDEKEEFEEIQNTLNRDTFLNKK